MGGRKLVISDVIEKSETVTLTVGDKTASKTVTLREPISVYLTMDDEPYNKSVRQCGGHVELLRDSVVACNAAEVATKAKTSQMLGSHISNGFLTYITTNVDMQNMEELSGIEAVASELHMQKEALDDKRDVMTDDYGILTTRYSALFQNIDKELASRIQMLLEPCFRFVKSSQREQQRNVSSSLLAMAMVGHKEQSELQAKLTASRVKQRAALLIENARNYLLGQKKLASHIAQVLLPAKKEGTYSVPVIFVEKSEGQGGNLMQLYMNPATREMGVSEQKVRQEIAGNQNMGFMKSEDKQQINQYLNNYIASAGSSEREKRVADTIRKLHGKFNPQTVIQTI